ncbi:MAG: ABC transporter ATP-binding protein [Bacteroidales bacterium]|nr:ABC transporter ATP-binding protein [Bacteroidales bacterium]
MIEVQQLTRKFRNGSRSVTALDQVSLSVIEGSFTLIKGPSGSGKTSLLFSIGGMLRPTSGTVRAFGKDLYALPASSRRKLIATRIAFVFQSYYLLPYLTVKENIFVQNRLGFISIDKDYVYKIIDLLGLTNRLRHKPAELSVGEKQRVVLARTLAVQPRLILADEPTGNLDTENSGIVLDIFKIFQKEGGTLLMVTHDHQADSHASRIFHLNHGRLNISL